MRAIYDQRILAMMGIRNRIFFYFIIFVMLISLESCHFGDADAMRPSFADRKRNVEYSLSVGLPFACSDVYSIEDDDIEGLKINWNESESIALFGKVFVKQADTLFGSAAIPDVIKLKFDARRDGTTGVNGNIKTLDLSFESWVKHGEGDSYAVAMPVVYPYSKVLDEYGSSPKCNADSLEFNFNGQDGRLQMLRDSFFVAIGNGIGVVNSGIGSISSANEDIVRLTPKFAIVRIALTFHAEEAYTLNQYIKVRSFSESVRYIDNITISNENANASGINKTVLNLATGTMKASENALPMIILRSKNAFIKLADIPYDNWISLEPIGGSKISWGTMLYVAVPCTDEGHLDLDALIDVSVVKRTDNTTEHYYGRLQPVTLFEGCYYLTSCVSLNTSIEGLERAEVLFVPGNASLPDND